MKPRTHIFIIGALFVIFILLYVTGTYVTEATKKPIIKEKFASQDYSYLYNFYFSSKPQLEGRPFIGAEGAHINLIGYMDPTADSTQQFFAQVYPTLEKEFIQTGKVRHYYKFYLLGTDIEEQNERYGEVLRVYCVQTHYPNLFVEQHQAVFQNTVTLPEDTNEAFEGCMGGDVPPHLVEDLSEVENFGMIGINPRFYIGIHANGYQVLDGVVNYQAFNSTIRQNMILLGD